MKSFKRFKGLLTVLRNYMFIEQRDHQEYYCQGLDSYYIMI